MRRLATVLASALLSTACVGSILKSDVEAPALYRLSAPAAGSTAAPLPLAIVVARPGAASSLDTERIAVVKPDHGFDYLAGARWADPAPQMVQQLLVTVLAAGGGFATTMTAPSRVPADLLLEVELRHFEAVYANVDAAPRIRVELQASVVEARSGTRLASFDSSFESAAERNDRRAVIAAFEQATGQAVQDVAARAREAAGSVHR